MKDYFVGWFGVRSRKFTSCAQFKTAGLIALGIAALLPVRSLAQTPPANQTTTSTDAVLGANYTVVSRNADSRVWQRALPIATNWQGQISYRTNSYTELATGLCYWTGSNWADS